MNNGIIPQDPIIHLHKQHDFVILLPVNYVNQQFKKNKS